MEQRILAYFEQRPNEYVSGEQLSELLECSRTAVWKHIRSLRERGYTFEAVPRKGYRLIGVPDRLNAAELLAALRTRSMGRSIKLFDAVESTQTIAHKLAEQGAAEGTLVLAEQQTAGRGRMGRRWHSPKGKGVWMSLVLRPQIPIHFTPQLTLLVAVALCRTVRKLGPDVPVAIKWPNDLLVEGKKISGILLESNAEDERLRYVIAGVGVSVNLEKDDYPDELRSVATSLRIASGREWSRAELIRTFLEQFEALYELYHAEGFEPIRSAWEAQTISIGRPIRARTPKGDVEGVAESIDEMGALLVRQPDGAIVKLYSAE
ncbi:biotin--[acetyl-CoA-carboxylase] ligase [Paenibacillus flagellatus]|uniref:Bifunctional ligase/repressor BirA n=1 Tax=Paenibacillus flagellatus TaxID=2211139 RepID=A0A2V5KYA4_9BACL|nr:biotin--[acetyl-CoA-carboxylase] ligase [Paenibacillus flagellatus]PYI54886.1 biotin--[acetyl-CoA-carboxylase] ligase [Paenibacillus flagellatus]